MEFDTIRIQKGLQNVEIMDLVYKRKFSRDKHNASPWNPGMQVHKNKIGDDMA